MEWTEVATTAVRSVLTFVHHAVVVAPLKQLYFQGPVLHGYGFWGGVATEDMCASMTPGTTAAFWFKNKDDCSHLVDLHFQSFLISVQTIIYLVTLYKLVNMFFFRTFVLRPALSQMQELLAHSQALRTRHRRRTLSSSDDSADTSVKIAHYMKQYTKPSRAEQGKK
jgi:hypothetical protein